jgi:chromate transporter
MRGIAAAAFVAIFFLDAPFPLIILAAGLIGYFGGRSGIAQFRGGGGHGPASGNIIHDRDTALGEALPDHARPNLRWSLQISIILLLLWLGPILALFLILGPDDVFTRIAAFFSQMAVVTFGGAYAVLAYVAQEAVGTFNWLRPGEMLDGLGMAETTPGPLIMVTQFVGFLAAFRDAGSLPPLLAATLGAILTTWVTFVPCFLWILAQSARSCDFGHLGEHVGNGLVVVDDRPCEERRSAPIRERRYEPWRFEWGSDRLLEPEFFGHRVRDRQSGDGTTGIGGSA